MSHRKAHRKSPVKVQAQPAVQAQSVAQAQPVSQAQPASGAMAENEVESVGAALNTLAALQKETHMPFAKLLRLLAKSRQEQ